jgi:hypothetical protein
MQPAGIFTAVNAGADRHGSSELINLPQIYCLSTLRA